MINEKFGSNKFSDFQDIKELYRSQSGAVYLGQFKYDKKSYILKERKISELGKKRSIMNEVTLLSQLNHPNIVKVRTNSKLQYSRLRIAVYFLL